LSVPNRTYLERDRCRFISRNGNLLNRFEALGDQLAAVLQIDEAIIDGEVIAVDETGRPQFYDLLRRSQAPAYVAFEERSWRHPGPAPSGALQKSDFRTAARVSSEQ